MELSQEAQKILNDFVVFLVPIVMSVISAWFIGWKNRRDTNAAFKKIRAHEEYLGFETKIKKGEVHVTSRSGGAVQSGSIPPVDLGPQGGKGS